MKKLSTVLLAVVATVAGAGCATRYAPRVANPSGVQTVYEDHRSTGQFAGMSLESQDIVRMSDTMVRDMLTSGILVDPSNPPFVLIDHTDFGNDSARAFNKKLIVNRIRIELQRAARGRMVFVSRQATASTEMERELKRSGRVSSGSQPLTRATAGVDYKLQGEFLTLDTRGGAEGGHTRYTQVSFEMVDKETNEIVWANIYEFRKASSDDLVYR